MNNINTTGYIYRLYFSNSDKEYVGSTMQIVDRRFKQYLNLLKNNKHHSIYMQNHYNKYGVLPMIEVMEKIDNCNISLILEREQWYIDNHECVLNMNRIAGIPRVKKIKIIQYCIEGFFIKVWDSAVDASLALNIHDTIIRNCIYDINKTAGGYQWRKYEDGHPSNISAVEKYNPVPPLRKKRINVYDLYGNIQYRCEDRLECFSKIGLPEPYVHVVKNTKIYKNYFVCDAEKFDADFITIPITRVGKYDMNGDLIKIYGEATQAMTEIGKPSSHVFAVLKGKQKKCFGFTYRYINDKIITKIQI